jgi:putative membrane protein
MTPAMIATWIFGLALAFIADVWSDPWFHAKLALVLAMTAFHVWLGLRLRDFRIDANRMTGRTYRIANELPTLLVIAIVILVVVKPF